MHRGGSLRGGLCGLSLIVAMALGGGVAVADGVPPSARAAWLRWSLQREAFSGSARSATSSFDAGSVGGADAAATDGGESSAAATPEQPGGVADDVADAGSAALDATSAQGALFGDPGWPYTAPTFDECFADPVVLYWVDGVSPPEGSPCDVD